MVSAQDLELKLQDLYKKKKYSEIISQITLKIKEEDRNAGLFVLLGISRMSIGLKDKNQVICEKKDMDRYKRIVAICYYDNKDLNKLMVKNGWAIAYRKYSKDYIEDESFARLNKLGIWKGNFTEPELWRKQNR